MRVGTIKEDSFPNKVVGQFIMAYMSYIIPFYAYTSFKLVTFEFDK